jgi:copper(I)-binding protein
MLVTALRRLSWPRRARQARAVAAGLTAVAALGVTGCAARAAATAPIEAGTAYVPAPEAGTTVAYVVIRNNGAADRLLSARTSAGGQVTFLAPVAPGGSAMRAVRTIAVQAHSTLAMVPDSYHLEITGLEPMHSGTDITLTLVFAHAGPVSVVSQIADPAAGGGSTYFAN